MRRVGGTLLALALAACGGGGGGAGPQLPGDPAPATPLCVASACGTKTVLLDIPSAENLLFADTGRLFVSGSENVYEITRPGGAWTATPISEGGSFGGMAQVGDVLYVNGFDGSLYAARLTATPSLAAIHALELGSPNGMTAGPDGELYITNGPIPQGALPDPKIVRVRLDPADALRVAEQADWLAFPFGVFPNGIQRRGGTLYVAMSIATSASFGVIGAIDIQPDGSALAATSSADFFSIPDDLGIAGEDVIVTGYTNGQLIRLSPQLELIESTDPFSFDNPSSVRLGRPPLFAPNELVVTEKGVVGLPPTPGYGNVLSVFTPDAP